MSGVFVCRVELLGEGRKGGEDAVVAGERLMMPVCQDCDWQERQGQ